MRTCTIRGRRLSRGGPASIPHAINPLLFGARAISFLGNLSAVEAYHEAPEWLAAAEALLLVAKRGGPTMTPVAMTAQPIQGMEPGSRPRPRRRGARTGKARRAGGNP